jgi:hypothetical protein
MNRRRAGQLLAVLLSLACFGWSIWSARSSAIPELRVYDGFLVLLGAAILVSLTAPLVWRWPRERSLVAIALAAVVGCIAPLGISALRHHMPLLVRLRGAWVIGGVDLVAPAVVVGFVCLWFAVRKHQGDTAGRRGGTTAL